MKLYKISLANLLALCLLGLSSQVFAQTVQRYQVDVMVFEHLALKGWTEEYWPSAIETTVIDGAQDLLNVGQPPLNLELATPMLEQEAARVAKNYRLLTHKSWIQNALEKNQTPKLLIEGEEGMTQFYGTVKMYQSRFNHVAVDFTFDRAIPEKVRDEFAYMQKLPITELPTQWKFALKAQRKVKSGELHYIDHPLFGILVQVQKIDSQEK